MALEPSAPPEDLEAELRRIDPDRWLSSRFVADAAERADVAALYAYDNELARAPRAASNPLLGEMRLTWWREALDEIFAPRPVRRHATALALAQAVARRGLPRAPLETMIDARYRDLDPAPASAEEVVEGARGGAGAAAGLAAAILDPAGDSGLAIAAGAAWALARQVPGRPELRSAFDGLMAQARRDARRLGAAAFPAAAHAVFAPARARGLRPEGLRARLAVTLAVARGRI